MTERAELPEPPDNYAPTEDILRYALVRIRADVEDKRAYLQECREQLETAELFFHEAITAERELARLIEGAELYKKDAPDAQVYDPRNEPGFGTEAFEDAVEELFWLDGAAASVTPLPEPPVVVIEPELEAARSPGRPPASPPPEKCKPGRSPTLGPLGDGRTLREIQTENLRAVLERLVDSSGALTISLSSLAKEAGIPDGSVLPIVNDLINAGELTRQKNYFPGSRSPAPSTYRLTGRIAPTEPEGEAIPAPEPPQREVSPVLEPVQRRPGAAPTQNDRILSALGAGDRSPRQLSEATGISYDTVNACLSKLRQHGLVERRDSGGNTGAIWGLRSGPDDPSMIPGSGVLPTPEREAEAAPYFPPDDPTPAPRAAAIDAPGKPSREPVNVRRDIEDDEEPGREIVLVETDGGSGARCLSGLRFGECRWPLDDPGRGEMHRTTFCAEPTGGETYCRKHTAMAFA